MIWLILLIFLKEALEYFLSPLDDYSRFGFSIFYWTGRIAVPLCTLGIYRVEPVAIINPLGKNMLTEGEGAFWGFAFWLITLALCMAWEYGLTKA